MKKKTLLKPLFFQGSDQDLHLESNLKELPLWKFVVETNSICAEVAEILEKYPRLPGMILVENDHFVGMLSRRRLLEYLLRPHAIELFWQKPLSVIYSYARSEILIISDRTPILNAAFQSLRRSGVLRSEPIIVMGENEDYQLLDVEELNVAYWQIRGIETQVRYERTQTHLIQTEKMASLGRLVDGISHEILDPVSFIWGNLTHVANYTKDLLDLIEAYNYYFPETPREIAQMKEEIELDYLQTDLPKAIDSIRSGAERLKKLGISLQNFCHIDDVYPRPADLHSLIDSIILLLKSHITSDIEIMINYGKLPPISCFVGQINQVFMNVLTYMIDNLLNTAITQQFAQDFQEVQTYKPGFKITITTDVFSKHPENKRWVSIIIADNGHGIKPEVKQEILASFSTGKRVFKETSLALSYKIITAKHGGEFHLTSEVGTGTEFKILLPLI